MPHYILATWLSGEASIRQSFTMALTLFAIWGMMVIFAIELLAAYLTVSAFVWLVNGLCFTWGAVAIFGASITSHSISISFLSGFAKFLARFCNFILLFAGIILIILVTSGEITWMTYLYKGIHARL